MRVVLFGTGAMACLFGARLAKFAEVTLVGTWKDAIETVRNRGILFEDLSVKESFQVQAQFLDDPPVPASLVLVCVKSWQTGRVAAKLEDYLEPHGVAITLQNGLGNVELLGPRAFAGSTEMGATLLGPGHVRAGGSGRTFSTAPDESLEILRLAGFETYRCGEDEVDSLLWGKLCISCGINALTGLLRVKNGELLEIPGACELMEKAASECAQVAYAKGIRLPYVNPEARVKEVARNTTSNRSSMYQDLLRRAPTECDAIYGSVVREAQRLKVDVPVNRMLGTIVCALVKRTGEVA